MYPVSEAELLDSGGTGPVRRDARAATKNGPPRSAGYGRDVAEHGPTSTPLERHRTRRGGGERRDQAGISISDAAQRLASSQWLQPMKK